MGKSIPFDERDLKTLGETVYGEARGESRQGQRAVAWVVRNRLGAGRWGGVALVCRAPKQFSCWNEGDSNLEAIRTAPLHEPITLEECHGVASGVLLGLTPDPTHGATHYHAKGCNPSWARGHKPSAVIGNHLFYNNID